MKHETDERKQRFALWIKKSSLNVVRNYYKADNCATLSEFIEKAILFYTGYLSGNDTHSYLPNVIISTLKSIAAESDNRQNRMMFKLAVELAMVQNLIAAFMEVDPLVLERTRGECVKEVARLNGTFSFEDALAWQKGWE